MLASPRHLLDRAQKGKYAVGAFNTSTISLTKAIFDAAEKLKSPVIVQTSEGQSKYGRILPLLALLRQFAEQVSIPVVIHQDHCRQLKMAKTCIASGYQSILYDASALPYEENVTITRQVADMAHKRGIFVEAELGGVGRGSILHKGKIPELQFTDPDQAVDFVKRTKVDSLAISFGNVHGVYKEAPPPRIDFDRLIEIRKKVNVPLVLHGSSGMRSEDIKKTISLGISKVNVNTDLRVAFSNTLRKVLKDPEAIVSYKFMVPVEKAVQKVVEEKIKLFGSAGKA